MKTLIALIVLATASIAAHAASPWVQTATALVTGTVEKQYVAPRSIQQVGPGNIYKLFVRTTFTPPTSGVQASLAEIVINCDNHTWGEMTGVAFAEDGEPQWFTRSDITRSSYNPLPVRMFPYDELTPGTANYICR